MGLLLLLAACSDSEAPTATPRVIVHTATPGPTATPRVIVHTATPGPTATPRVIVHTATPRVIVHRVTLGPESTMRLEQVKARGRLSCAGRNDFPGLGHVDSDGNLVGFDFDLCRAVAAAVLGEPNAVQFRLITAAERGPEIQSGELDVLVRHVKWTTLRDAQWGNFTHIMFYDGQGFMVRGDSGFRSALDLDGASVCVTEGTKERDLMDYFTRNRMAVETVTLRGLDETLVAYEEGRCDAVTSYRSTLAAVRALDYWLTSPGEHVILPETIAKDPTAPVVPHGDDQWFDIVKTVMYVLINAEEMGVTQANVEQMKSSDDLRIRRMLGVEGTFGQAELGLDADFAVDVLRAVGNYGEIYDRNMGAGGLKLPRGDNELWTNGGLIYAPPLWRG